MEGLYFHDLGHSGNQYPHEARGADKRITDAIDTHVLSERANDDDDGAAGALAPLGLWLANGP
jgi:hypothetical protein